MNLVSFFLPHVKRKSLALSKISTIRIYPSAERNKSPILETLKSLLPRYLPRAEPDTPLHCLEVASGTGQHVAHFAPHFPHVTFQPSETEAAMLDSIAAHAHGIPNVRPPVQIDIRLPPSGWRGCSWLAPRSLHLLLNVNMVHISPPECAEGLFRAATELLLPGGLLFMYGPFAFHGRLEPDSNRRFDETLRAQCAEWGVRDVDWLAKIGGGFRLVETVPLPANNHVLVWQRQ